MEENKRRLSSKTVKIIFISTAMFLVLLSLVLLIVFLQGKENETKITSCVLRAEDNPTLATDVSAQITDSTISLVLPADFNNTTFLLDVGCKASLLFDGEAYVNRQTPVSREKITVTVENETGERNYYKLYITQSNTDSHALQNFIFEASKNDSLQSDIVCKVAGSKISGYLPSSADLENLVPTFVLPEGEIVGNNGIPLENGSTFNFADCNEFVSKFGEKERTYTVELDVLADDSLPCVYLYSDSYNDSDIPHNRYTDKENPKEARFSIFNAESPLIETKEYEGEKISIKLRGNSSLDFPKKNYTVRFENKVSLLGMTESRKYVLQSNYCDKSLMRNALAFTLSEKLDGLDYTSDYRYVNLFINGKYHGNYMLIERIDVGDDRLNITEQTGAGDISGGYLLELCERKNKDYMIFPADYPVSIRYPEIGELTVAQVDYIEQYFTEMIEQINSGKDIEKYIDVDSFVDWLLLNELMKANDAKGYASVYLYKDAGGVMHMGPIWDYDISSGNCDYGEPDPQGEWIGKHMWFPELLENKEFLAKAKSRWAEIRDDMYGAFDDIDTIKSQIYKSQEDNFEKWKILGHYVWPNGKVCKTYDEEVEYLKEWLTERLEWMDSVYLE